MRGWVIVVSGILFCAVSSFLGDTSLLMGTVTQSWAPYVTVPFAMGFIAVRTTVVRAGLVGALSSVMLVVAFYAASNPARTGGYSVDTASIFQEYGPLGIVTGFLLAALSRSLAPSVARARARSMLVICCVLILALIGFWWIIGWGRHEVVTSSGVATVGASLGDVVASSAIVLGFSSAAIGFAIHGLPRLRDRRTAAEVIAR